MVAGRGVITYVNTGTIIARIVFVVLLLLLLLLLLLIVVVLLLLLLTHTIAIVLRSDVFCLHFIRTSLLPRRGALDASFSGSTAVLIAGDASTHSSPTSSVHLSQFWNRCSGGASVVTVISSARQTLLGNSALTASTFLRAHRTLCIQF